MAAAPFKVSMVAKARDGSARTFYLTASDVANEYLIFPSGGSEVPLNTAQDVWIADMQLSAAGTDTTRLELFINGVSSGQVLLNAACLTTAVGRGIQQAPIRIIRGSAIKWKQLA